MSSVQPDYLEKAMDKVWEEWKIINHLPKNDETAYLNQMWFYYYLKRALFVELALNHAQEMQNPKSQVQPKGVTLSDCGSDQKEK